jgi:DNA-binding CsgD family transcriptional regulator
MNSNGAIDLPVAEVIFRDDLYPRIKADPTVIQRYAENLDLLPPIEVNQRNEIIDGYHRWTAHRKAEADTVKATVTQTATEAEFLQLAIKRNAAHGLQLAEQDKRKMAVRLYAAGTGIDKAVIAGTLSISPRTVNNYLHDIDRQLREERKQAIFGMWMACYSQEEIAAEVGVTQKTIGNHIATFSNNGTVSTFTKSRRFAVDDSFAPPLYNIWTFAKISNRVSHFGNSEQSIVDNLLYLYTEPFDIVLDPFAGGGSTIEVCRHRLRRYWVSDRKPIVERENEIRQHDIVTDGVPPLNRNWSEVSLTYLDPPYWKQAEDEYSDDPTDLANMPLEDFTKTLAGFVKEIARRQSKGAIALLIQPTQWRAPGRQIVDHVIDLVNAVGNRKLVLETRVSCPYTSEQYNAQQVKWAKENGKLLCLTRELIIWRLGE